MQRRDLLQKSAAVVCGFFGLKLTGCGNGSENLSLSALQSAQNSPYKDIQVYSDGDPSSLYDEPVITGAQIEAGQELTLSYELESHFFTLTPEHFAALRSGKVIELETTVDLNHTHLMTIDPNHQPKPKKPDNI